MTPTMAAGFLAATWWIGAAVGITIAVRGAFFRQVKVVAFGMCVGFYSLTGENYAPLAGSVPEPLNTLERGWGAISAVLGGCACVGVMIAVRRQHQRDLGLDEWSDSQLHQRLLWLVLLASLSIATIALALKPYDLAPTTTFLADYGDLPGVAVYEIVFAIWIMIPVGTLAWTSYQARTLGPARWCIVGAGVFGNLWGLWKVTGTVAALFGESVAHESRVSVELGLACLAAGVLGIVAIGACYIARARAAKRQYQRDRSAEDERLRAHGFRAAIHRSRL